MRPSGKPPRVDEAGQWPYLYGGPCSPQHGTTKELLRYFTLRTLLKLKPSAPSTLPLFVRGGLFDEPESTLFTGNHRSDGRPFISNPGSHPVAYSSAPISGCHSRQSDTAYLLLSYHGMYTYRERPHLICALFGSVVLLFSVSLWGALWNYILIFHGQHFQKSWWVVTFSIFFIFYFLFWGNSVNRFSGRGPQPTKDCQVGKFITDGWNLPPKLHVQTQRPYLFDHS